MAKITISTPIYYVNAQPHIGSAYTTIAADVLARYYRQHGNEVLLSTGTDENSQKTLKAADSAGQKPTEYLEQMAADWKQAFDDLQVGYDRFIRTTEPDHKKAVNTFVKSLKSEDLYQGEYEGLYCTGCEEFKRPEDLVDGKCPLHNVEPEKIKEKNYFFRLSNYQQALLDHIKENPDFIQPVTRRNEIVSFIERGLVDISLTRQNSKWGIPYPLAEDQVLYVWIEALVNYLTVVGYPDDSYKERWPTSLNIIGKDISKFHCVYWPAMLMSAGLPLPKRVFVHGFLTSDGQKMSKSLGNVVDPLEIAQRYGVEPLRFYLLRETPFGVDGDFSEKRLMELYNSELANELGNLVQRTAVMLDKYQDGNIGEVLPHSHDVHGYHEAMKDLRFDKALHEVWLLIRGLNQYVEEEKPWELAKSDREQLADVLAHLAVDLLQVAELLTPFMPTTAERIIKTFEGGKAHLDVGILFPKAE